MAFLPALEDVALEERTGSWLGIDHTQGSIDHPCEGQGDVGQTQEKSMIGALAAGLMSLVNPPTEENGEWLVLIEDDRQLAAVDLGIARNRNYRTFKTLTGHPQTTRTGADFVVFWMRADCARKSFQVMSEEAFALTAGEPQSLGRTPMSEPFQTPVAGSAMEEVVEHACGGARLTGARYLTPSLALSEYRRSLSRSR